MSGISLHNKLNTARQELLDLGLRNPLLNYRTLRARGLDIVDERSSDVFGILVRTKKRMSFLVRERAEGAEEGQPELAAPPVAPQAYKDAKLQTNYTDKQLQSRLLNTYTAARTYVEEQGVNILYMALGMLHWYESDSSQELRKAPLVLVPVQMDRVSARERFTVAYTEDEIGHNVSLVAKMKHDYGLAIPAWEDEEVELSDYLAKVSAAIEGRNRWTVEADAVAIGFFSFGKFLMYWDLDADNWPEHAKLHQHPIMTALLEDGFHEPPSAIREDEHLDQHLRPEDSNLIKEADSSQLLAIADANQGRNLVIQGPPGTGKSQTITNLIAEAIGSGKKVLFVSEKMAALEVVKRRLDEVGLGIACLELHSHKTNKKTLLHELSNTLDLGRPMQSPSKSAVAVSELRDRLNAYCDAMHAPIGDSGTTTYQALGELMLHKESASSWAYPNLRMDAMAEWSEEANGKRELLVEELQSVLAAVGVPRRHPFWGSRKTLILPQDQPDLLQAIGRAIRAAQAVQEFDKVWSGRIGNPALREWADGDLLAALSKRVLAAPPLAGIDLESDHWVSSADSLRQLVEAGRKARGIRSAYEGRLIAQAWDAELLNERRIMAAWSGKWWKFMSGDFRGAKQKIQGLLRSPGTEQVDFLAIIDAIMDSRQAAKDVLEKEGLGQTLFGPHWKGIHTDWDTVSELLDGVGSLKREIGEGHLPTWTLAVASNIQELQAASPIVQELEQRLIELVSALGQAERALEFEGKIRFENQGGLAQQTFADLLEVLDTWTNRIATLPTLGSYNRLAGQCEDLGLGPVVELAEHWELAAGRLLNVYRWNRYEALVVRAFREREALSQFEGSRHEHAIHKFCELDIDLTHRNRYKLAEAHWRMLPHYDAGGQLGVLRREFEKKTRHLPIRQLMAKAGNAIQAIKPVFMMGPLSIATYIHPGSLEFDLVIFDEASQVKPVDAFGAILRGKQIVVVGDSKQMPPTNFFDTLSKEEEHADEEDNFVGDMESILGLCLGQNAPQRMLRWHYRSRHQSLIAVSNHEFYEDKLVVFPSPDADRLDSGLRCRYLEHTSYDRGKTRTNPLEAKAIADAVMEHARTTPHLSLGVAAFSMVQMQAILDELEKQRRTDVSCEPYFISHPHEPFFVKNLENIQGDERDVILISIGYGKTADGQLAMDFGALNREGGERRLNVLITRARIRCEVFTNLKAADIDLKRSGSRGVKALKTFLNYAETGHLDSAETRGQSLDSTFEEAVYAKLTQAGYKVKRQVGSAGCSVDLAVLDPERPGNYLLGIECDGVTYNSARSARDRDRLRQQVLEGLGWRLHRIWSVDWFRHPEREWSRLIESIEKARIPGAKIVEAASGGGQSPALEIQREGPIDTLPEMEMPTGLKYETADIGLELAGTELQELPIAQLAIWVYEVVKVESPIHVSEITRRLSEAAGMKRIGPRVQDLVGDAVGYLEFKDKVNPMGDFVWMPGMSIPPVRDRSELTLRKLELIAPQELSAAIVKVVRDSFGMERVKLPQAVCHVLGLSRATDEIRSTVDELVGRMVAKQFLIERGSQISLAG